MANRWSQHFPQTRRSRTDRDTSTPLGQRLLEQAGFMRSSGAAGIYSLLPLGFRVHRRICDIIYAEMEADGILNMQLPILQSREVWERTGRWESYVASKTMFSTVERHRGTEFGLAPTAEEVVTALVASDVRSWRELPLILHQIGPKFRDEIRPRLGLLRCREFVMSDAYSFDRNEEGMRSSFELLQGTYRRIFDRVGVPGVIAVEADSGAIGGTGSAEFMAVSDVGEDVLLGCTVCTYGANAEKADSRVSQHATDTVHRPMRRYDTPNVTTVEELAQMFPDVSAEQMVKTLLFAVGQEDVQTPRSLVGVCIRGDLEVNEVKLSNIVGEALEPATAHEIHVATGARVGFAGPINLRGVQTLYFDASVLTLANFLCGVNENDVHALDVNFGSNIAAPSHDEVIEVHLAKGGYGCPQCSGTLMERRGIELGHVFMLQTGYAEKLDATYTTEEGHAAPLWMGCYGIGTTRLLQAVAELCNDKDGLIWPVAIAPYEAHVILTQPEDQVQRDVGHRVCELLESLDLAVIVDDRTGSPGTKFKDADLVGCPVRITVGRRAAEGVVEVRARCDGRTAEVEIGAFMSVVDEAISRARKAHAR